MRRQPFHVWVLDNVGPFGVKRLKADRQLAVPEVLRFCREVFERQVPFDYKLGLGDDSLYCVEMTEKAFRSAGLKLSEPVRIRDMERRKEFPICFFVFRQLSTLTLDQQLFFPGNERHGIWSSPLLEQVYPRARRHRPAAPPSRPSALRGRHAQAGRRSALKLGAVSGSEEDLEAEPEQLGRPGEVAGAVGDGVAELGVLPVEVDLRVVVQDTS